MVTRFNGVYLLGRLTTFTNGLCLILYAIILLFRQGGVFSEPPCDALIAQKCPPFTAVDGQLLAVPDNMKDALALCANASTITKRVERLQCVKNTIRNNSGLGEDCNNDSDKAWARQFLEELYLKKLIIYFCNNKKAIMKFAACIKSSQDAVSNCSASNASAIMTQFRQYLPNPPPETTEMTSETFICKYTAVFYDCYTRSVVLKNCSDSDHDYYKSYMKSAYSPNSTCHNYISGANSYLINQNLFLVLLCSFLVKITGIE